MLLLHVINVLSGVMKVHLKRAMPILLFVVGFLGATKASAFSVQELQKIDAFLTREYGTLGHELTPSGETLFFEPAAKNCFARVLLMSTGSSRQYVPENERGARPRWSSAPVGYSHWTHRLGAFVGTAGTWPLTRFAVLNERRWVWDLTPSMRQAIVRVWDLSDRAIEHVLSGRDAEARTALSMLYRPDLCTGNGELSARFRRMR